MLKPETDGRRRRAATEGIGPKFGVDAKAVRLENVELVDDKLEIRVRPQVRHRWRCPHCQERFPGYDQRRERRWRALDFGRTKTSIVAIVPRVRCGAHDVVVARVPWARHDARHTLAFEQLTAWGGVDASARAASRLLRCRWRAIVGSSPGLLLTWTTTHCSMASGASASMRSPTGATTATCSSSLTTTGED